MRWIDWAVLGAFVVPTGLLAGLWAFRDLQERSHLWSRRPDRWLIATGYWLRALLIILVAIALAAAAAWGFQFLAN